MQNLRASKGVAVGGSESDETSGDNRDREKSVTFKEERDDSEPGWFKRNSISAVPPSSTPSDGPPQPPRVFPISKFKYNKEQLLELYKPSTQLPSAFSTYPIITSEEVLIPVALLPPDLQDEKIPSFVRRSSIGRGRGRGRGTRTPWDDDSKPDYVLGERRLPRHSFDAGDLGRRGRNKMWSESDSEDDDYKYENDDDDDEDEEREAPKNRRRASVAVSQFHAHSKKSDVEKVVDDGVTEDTMWLYRDPQGDTQGPFTNSDMSGWYEAGYFGPDLMVKREQDPTFVLLRVLTKKNGPGGPSTNPFIVTPPTKSKVQADEESEESSEESEEEQLKQPTVHIKASVQPTPPTQSKPLESVLRKSTELGGSILRKSTEIGVKIPRSTSPIGSGPITPTSTSPIPSITSPVAIPSSGRSALTSSFGPTSTTPPLSSPTSVSSPFFPSPEDILLGERLHLAKALAQQPKSTSPPPIQQPKSQSPPPLILTPQQQQHMAQLTPQQQQQLQLHLLQQHQFQLQQLQQLQQMQYHMQQQQQQHPHQQQQSGQQQPSASPLRTSGHMMQPQMPPGPYPDMPLPMLYEQMHRWSGGVPPPHELAQLQQLQKQQQMMMQQHQQQQQQHSQGPHSQGPHSQGPHSQGPHSQGQHQPGHPQQPHPLSHSMEQFLPHMYMDPQQQFLLQQQQMMQHQMLERSILQQQLHQQQHPQQQQQNAQSLKRKEGVFILNDSDGAVQTLESAGKQQADALSTWMNRPDQRRPSLREIQEEELRRVQAQRSELSQSGQMRNELTQSGQLRADLTQSSSRNDLNQSGGISKGHTQAPPQPEEEEEFWEMPPTGLRASSEVRKSSDQQQTLAQLAKQNQAQSAQRSTSPVSQMDQPPQDPTAQTTPKQKANKAQKTPSPAQTQPAQQVPLDRRQSTPNAAPQHAEQRRPSEPVLATPTPSEAKMTKKEKKKAAAEAAQQLLQQQQQAQTLPANVSWGSQQAEPKKVKSLQEIQEEELQQQQQLLQQQIQQQKESEKKQDKKAPAPVETLRTSGGVKKMTLREIQEEELRELQKRKEVEDAHKMELLKQQTLMFQQQNAIKWGNSAWSESSSASPASRSLREIQEEEQKKKEKDQKKKDKEEQQKRKEEERRREEDGGDLLWAAQTQGTSKMSLREIQEQERKREKAQKEKEASKAKDQQVPTKPTTPRASSENAWSSLLSSPTDDDKKSSSNKSTPTTPKNSTAKTAPAAKPAPPAAKTPAPPAPTAKSGKKAAAKPSDDDDDNFWDIVPEKSKAKAPAQAKPQQPQPTQTQTAKQKKAEKKAGSQDLKSSLTFGGPTVSSEFMKWCLTQIKSITGHDNPTLAEFLLSLQSANDVRDYVTEYMGSSGKAQKFATEFVGQREFEIGNAQTTSNGHSAQASAGTSGSKKSSKKKMQKMDPNLLGFVSPPINDYTSD